MPTALIVTADMGGNLPPVIGIGRALAARGWTVVLHGDAPLQSIAEAAGFGFTLAEGVRYDPRLARSTPAILRELPPFWADRSRGRHAVATARRLEAEVVVVDTLLLGTIAELESARVRTAVVLHSTWEGVHAFFGGPLGLALRLQGIDAFRVLGRADLLLVASHSRLGRPAALPSNADLTGPVLQEAPPAVTRAAPPVVLLGLSTVDFGGQRQALQRLLDAVADLPITVKAGSGAVDPAGLRVGSNTELSRSVDHAALMPQASAIISHGGHSTAVRALAHGLPMLLVPMHPLMDQPRIAKAIASAGAGLVLPKSASPVRIRAALERLLSDPTFGDAAARLGHELVAADGASRAASLVESLSRIRTNS